MHEPAFTPSPRSREQERANELTYACRDLERRMRALQSEADETALELREKRYLSFALQEQIRAFYREELQNRGQELEALRQRLDELGYPYQS